MNFKSRSIFLASLLWLGVHAQPAPSAAPGTTISALRATELRADKLGTALVLQTIAGGARMRMLSMEGGWVLVETAASDRGARTGWVRANAVNVEPAVFATAWT